MTLNLMPALRARFPGKRVRFVSFSHYHPDYTGGLRPFLADSAEVVCAGANMPFVDEVAHLNFSVTPDRLWREPRRLFWRYLVTNPVAIAMLLLRTGKKVAS